MLTIVDYQLEVESVAKKIATQLNKEPATVAKEELITETIEQHPFIVHSEWHHGILYFTNNKDAWAEMYEVKDLAEIMVNENSPDNAIATMAIAAFTADITDELENLE